MNSFLSFVISLLLFFIVLAILKRIEPRKEGTTLREKKRFEILVDFYVLGGIFISVVIALACIISFCMFISEILNNCFL